MNKFFKPFLFSAFFVSQTMVGDVVKLKPAEEPKSTSKDNSLKNEKENVPQVVNDFVKWHNDFFSGKTDKNDIATLGSFFATDIYFEVDGRAIASGLPAMVEGYTKNKNKGHKLVEIMPFAKIETKTKEGIIEFYVEHDIDMILKDGSKKVLKSKCTFFIRNNKIFKYIERF